MIILHIYVVIAILIGGINIEHYLKSEEGLDRWIMLGIIIGISIWPIIGIKDIILESKKHKNKLKEEEA